MVKPKYIAGTFLILIIAATCYSLSAWQFSRLHERKVLNKKISSRMTMKSVPLGNLLDVQASTQAVAQNEYRRVSLAGHFVERSNVLISGRSEEGAPGYNVLTLFEQKDKTYAYVNRGWIPQSLGDALLSGDADAEIITPPASKSITGLVRLNERKQLFSDTKQVSPDKKVTPRISTVLLKNISGKKYGSLYPLWIHQIHERNDRYPHSLKLPELTELNHFSYAIQWIIFGTTAIITWIVVCRKAYRKQRKSVSGAEVAG